MNSLIFPDVNVWLALLLADHRHRSVALAWWKQDESEAIAFCRLTQVSVLRLLTTAAAMNQQPLSMREAWAAYDRLFEDDRVVFVNEPSGLEPQFRRVATLEQASPKLWADAYLLAFAAAGNGSVVTFDRGLAGRGEGSVVLLGEGI